jgi:hypothetical protein
MNFINIWYLLDFQFKLLQYKPLWVIDWLLFNANSEMFQLYHVKNKLIFDEIKGESSFVLDQNASLDFNSASSLKEQSVDMSPHSDTFT